MSIVSTPYGKMRIIDTDRVVSRSLALYGEWAEDELKLLQQIITPGAYVLDVGAFIGTHTIAFSKFVGTNGKVYSFEPRKELYSILSENISLNNCHNVIAFNMGLARHSQKISLPRIDINQTENFGGLSLNKEFSSNSDSYEIQISTIDSLDIEKIDLIKLDVEEMERSVLDGSIRSLSIHRPVIFCECNSLMQGKELLDFCHEQQYQALGFLASAYNPENFNGVKENFFENAKELALLLVPDEKLEATLNNVTTGHLLPIHTLEDLVLPLLHKPQYAYEVLANTNTCATLGINFPSPAAVTLSQIVAERDEQIQRLVTSISWRITKPLRWAIKAIRGVLGSR